MAICHEFIQIGVKHDLKTDGNIGLNQEQNLNQTPVYYFRKQYHCLHIPVKCLSGISIRDPSFDLHYQVAVGIIDIIYAR